MIFRTQEQLNNYLSKLKEPTKSKYYGLTVGPEGLNTEAIDREFREQAEKDAHVEKPTGAQVEMDLDAESKTESEAQDAEEPAGESDEPKQGREDGYYDLDSEYQWQKKTAIGNVGEDLAGSARHKRNEDRDWQTFEQFAADQENKVFTRKDLEKAFPINWAALEEKWGERNDIMALGLMFQSVIRTMPTGPGGGANGWDFIELYKKLHGVASANYAKLMDGEVVKFDAVRDELRNDLRTQAGELSKHELWRKPWGGLTDEERNKKNALYAKYNDIVKVHSTLSPLKSRSPDAKVDEVFTQSINEVLAGTDYATIRDLRAALKTWRTSDKVLTPEQEKLVVKLQEVSVGRFREALRGGSIKKRSEASKRFTNLREDSFYKDIELRRSGPETHFTDYNKSIDYLQKSVAFRGIQYGNSVTDSKKIEHLVNASNSFKDLGKALGLADRKMSFDGKLGIAFGARGTGKAAAHYEPSTNIIAMTKEKGYGALAHEWGHALDYNARSSKIAYNTWVLEGKTSTPSPGVALVDKIATAKKAMQSVTSRMRKDINEKIPNLSTSSRHYWLSEDEVFARTFESYVAAKTKAQGVENTYLVAERDHFLWPNKEEQEAMSPHFDAIIEAYKKV